MLGANTDVSTMNLIVERYRHWRDLNPEGELKTFVVGFIKSRYESSGESSDARWSRKKKANRALEPYIRQLNHDGDTSLLALLGAISEAERFPVKPGRVMRKVYRKNQDIPSYIFGGYGISDLDECFRVAGRECRKGT